MSRRILLIQGHPDATRAHLCHALADAYAEGAREAGHLVALFPRWLLDEVAVGALRARLARLGRAGP